MKRKIITVYRNKIIVDGSEVARNYWYRQVIYIIQHFLDANEEKIVNEIGESDYESFYDLIDEYSDKVEFSEFDDESFHNNLKCIGEQITDAILHKSSTDFTIFGHLCPIEYVDVDSWSCNFFANFILPYLEISYDQEIEVDGPDTVMVDIIRRYLNLNKYNVIEINQRKIKNVTVDRVNEKSFVWIGGRQEIEIRCDLLSRIPIRLTVVNTDNVKVERVEYISFPFYTCGDKILVKITEEGSHFFLVAENITNHLVFKREID